MNPSRRLIFAKFSWQFPAIFLSPILLFSISIFGHAQQGGSTDAQVSIEMLSHLASYRAGSMEQATLKWQNLAQDTSLVAKPFEKGKKRLAGLAYVLASYGWNQLEDPRAFGTWQAALELFLELGSYWEQEVSRQMERLSRLDNDLASISPQSQSIVASPVQLDAEILLWQELEKHLVISEFKGPKALQLTSPEASPMDLTSRPSAPVPFLVEDDPEPSQTEVAPVEPPTMQPGPAGLISPPPRATTPNSLESSPEPTVETPKNTAQPTIPKVDNPNESSGYGSVSQAFLEALEDEFATNPTDEEISDVEDNLPFESQSPESSIPNSQSPLRNVGTFLETKQGQGTRVSRSGSDPLFALSAENSSQSFQIPPFDTLENMALGWRTPSPNKIPLSPADKQAARIAWQYVIRNYQSTTGLINAVEAYPFATIWDLGSGLAAMICAHQLGVISAEEFTDKWRLMLATLEQLPLYDKALPNREYNVQTAQMTHLKNQLSSEGSGWSAIDLGRILSWLAILKTKVPEAENQVNRLVRQWDLSRACRNGQLFGAFFDGKQEIYRQEGRLGYEQYAAAGFSLWNLPVTVAQSLNFDSWVDVEGFVLPNDNRNLNYLTSEPFILASLEHEAMAPEFRRLTELMYLTQKQKFKRTGTLTAVSEDAIARYPWFVYNSVIFGDKAWVCVDRHGRSRPNLKSFSTKAGWAWSALFVDDYSDLLHRKALTLNTPEKGFYSGSFDNGASNQSLNINTNAVILEALYYKARNGRSFLSKEASP